MKNRDFRESYNRSILLLALLISLYYVLSTYVPLLASPAKKIPVSEPVYVEIAKENEPSYIAKFAGDLEANKFVESYRLDRLPKSGDKLIIDGNRKILFSRIDGRKSLILGVPIGINSAAVEDLENLPGIGPKLAQKIIDYREIHGTFENLYELKNVDGIGEKKFSSIKKLISLD